MIENLKKKSQGMSSFHWNMLDKMESKHDLLVATAEPKGAIRETLVWPKTMRGEGGSRQSSATKREGRADRGRAGGRYVSITIRRSQHHGEQETDPGRLPDCRCSETTAAVSRSGQGSAGYEGVPDQNTGGTCSWRRLSRKGRNQWRSWSGVQVTEDRHRRYVG